MNDEPLKFPLTKPIDAHGEEVSELTFRAPTALDLIEVGCPVRIDMGGDAPTIHHDERRFATMMSRLAAVPPSSIARMDHRDFIEAEHVLTPFFMPRPGRI